MDSSDATSVAAGPAAVFTPASMTNIAVGSVLLVDRGTAQETVTVTATTATTFTAVAAHSHDGTATAFPILSRSLPNVGQGWLSFLTVQGNPDPTTSAALGGVLTDLLDYSRIKQALSPNDQRLLAVLSDPAAATPGAGGQTALTSLTGWAQSSIDALLTQFFGNTAPANLATVANFRRVYDAYAIVTASGLSASVLVSAITNSPTPATVSTLQSALRAQYAESDWLTAVGPINDAARILQRDALVAYAVQQLGDRYVQSIVNQTTTAATATGGTKLTLADASKVSSGMLVQGPGIPAGASVAGAPSGNTVTISPGILATLPSGSAVAFIPADAVSVTDADGLYEYFLIDTQTQPPVLTSRIRLALSAVQLFIERIVRNLEPHTSPTDVDASQWTWMKRYRVWQANREVFLWPENWLYPELRNNQSPLFQQMMSSLLQGDITDDAAASAYLTYLTGLEEVAKLEPCGFYYQPATADADETAYVIARTAGAHCKYYFRELSSGAWTPWAQVQIDCEGLPLTPIVWNGRLFLFWLKTFKEVTPQQAKATSANLTGNDLSGLHLSDLLGYSADNAKTAGNKSVQVSAALCWTEYYNGAWQPTKTSEISRPTAITSYDNSGAGSFEACRGLLRIVPGIVGGRTLEERIAGVPSFTPPAGSLILAITDTGGSVYGGFLLHNTHSLPVRFEDLALQSTKYILKKGGTPLMVPFKEVLSSPSPARAFPDAHPYTGAYGAGTFSIKYQQSLSQAAVHNNKILSYSWMPHWVDTQPGLPDAWDAPFFYEDRRNLFYVTTTENLVPVWRYRGFGVQWASAAESDIPSLVLRDQPDLPVSDTAVAANAAAGGAFTVQQYLSTSPTLNAALASPNTVTYQGQVISPVGSDPGGLADGTVRLDNATQIDDTVTGA